MNQYENEDRRKSDRRASPAIAEFALQERGELLARIAELEAIVPIESELRAKAERAVSMLEQQRGGVVLPEREEFDKWFRHEQLISESIDTTWISESFLPYRAWMARSRLTPPGECVAVDELDISAERNAMQRQRDDAIKQLARECDDTDSLIRILGLDPEQLRTDGGFLNIAKASPLLAQQGKESK